MEARRCARQREPRRARAYGLLRITERLLVPSAIVFVAAVSAKSDNPAPWNSLREQAAVASQHGLDTQAEGLLRSAIASLPDQKSAAAVILWNELGSIHQTNRVLDLAVQDFQFALSINRQLANADEEQTAVALNNLGTIAGERGEIAQAEKLLQESYRILVRINRTGGQTAALVKGNLALTFQQEGRKEEARSLYDRASADAKRWYGQESIQYARILTNQALLEMNFGAYQNALDKGRLAAEIQRRLPYVSDADRALTSNNLGFTLEELGEFAEAESWLLDAIHCEEKMPSGDKQLISSLNNLAALEEKEGRLNLAREHEGRATKLIEAGAGVDDTVMAAVWNNLGRISASEHDRRQARQLYAKALQIWEKAPERENAYYAATLSNVAALESAERHHKKSEALYRRALAIDESHLGPNHPEIASDLSNIATELFYQKQHGKALELYARARSMMEVSLGPSNLQVARTWRNMAVVNYARKDFEAAAYAYGKAVELLDSYSGGKDANLSGWLREYSGALRKAQRFSEAEAAETRALGIEVRTTLANQKLQKDTPAKDKGDKS